jgi:hypothetical protein
MRALQVLENERSHGSEEVAGLPKIHNVGEGIPQVVAAMRQAVGQLSEHVADDLKTLPRRGGLRKV